MNTTYSMNSSKGSAASLSLLVISLLVLLAFGPAAAADDSEVYYAIHYAGEGCHPEDSSSAAVSVVGYVSGVQNEVFGPPPSDNKTCLEAIPCQLDPTKVAWDCSVQHNFTHTIVGDEVVNSATNEVLSGCETTSDWYGDCNYDYQTLDDIKYEPDILKNDMEVPAEDEFIYLAFYEDDSCIDLSTIVTKLSGQVLTVPRAMNDTSLSCKDASLCALNPNAPICAERVDLDDTADLNASARATSDSVFQCDTSNQYVGEEECNEYTPQDCIKSSLYANCYFRYLSGNVMGKNPHLLLGEADNDLDDHDDHDHDHDHSEDEFTCDCQPTEGYLVTRLWNIVDSNFTDLDVIEEFNTGFAPLVTHMAGFQRYTAATTGNSSTVFFTNQFDTAEHAKAAQEGAKDFVKNGILDGVITPNQFTEDQLVFSFDSSDCVTADSTSLFLDTRLYNLFDNVTPESMYHTGQSLYNQTLQHVDGFVSYSGALSTPNYEQVFVYNIFETQEGATEANNAGMANAKENTNNDVPTNELVVTTSGSIVFDYLCAADNAPPKAPVDHDDHDHDHSEDDYHSGSSLLLVSGAANWLWTFAVIAATFV